MVRSLIGIFALRSNPVSKVYQHLSHNDGILEVTWSTESLRERTVKGNAVGEFTPDPFPQLAYGTGPNRTCSQLKFTSVNQYTLLKIFKGTVRILPSITIQMHPWSDSYQGLA